MGKQGAERVVSTTYLHVSNSGVTVSVVDDGFGPALVVESSSFGNLVSKHKTYLSKDGLREVRDMLERAIAHDGYSDTYCCAAHAPAERGCGTARWPGRVKDDAPDSFTAGDGEVGGK